MQRAGPCIQVWRGEAGGISWEQNYSLRSVGSQPYTETPKPEHQGQEEEPAEHLVMKISRACPQEEQGVRWSPWCPLPALVLRSSLSGTRPGLW